MQTLLTFHADLMDSKKPRSPLWFILGFLVSCLFSLAKFDITLHCLVWQLCFRNTEKACHPISSTTSYIGWYCLSGGWFKCTICEGFSCTWKTYCELALGSRLSSIWTIFKYISCQSNAPWCCIGKCPLNIPILILYTSYFSNWLFVCWQRNSIYARVDSVLRKIRETSEVICTHLSYVYMLLVYLIMDPGQFFAQTVQGFAAEYLKTPLGEPVKGKKEKSTTELWLEKFYKKTTNLPEPFPHELVERLEKYLNVSCCYSIEVSDLSGRLDCWHFSICICLPGPWGASCWYVFIIIWSSVKGCLLEQFRYSSEHHVHPTVSYLIQDIYFSYFFKNWQYVSKKVIVIIHNFVNCRYVDHVLTSERDNMKCCKIEYKYPVHSSQTYIYGGILIAGFIVYFVVIFFSSPVRWSKSWSQQTRSLITPGRAYHCHADIKKNIGQFWMHSDQCRTVE